MNKLLTLQQKADEYLLANPSALQILLQMQQSALRLNKATLRAANTCGCIKLGTQKLPAVGSGADLGWQKLKQQPTGDDLAGLCPECRHEIKDKLGSLLFYAAALANALDISLDDLVEAEITKLDLLGYFMMG